MEDAIRKLLQGVENFKKNYYHEDTELFDKLKRTQTPKVLLIGCSDSRVDPALLTGCQPGDLFIIRNVANLIPPYEDEKTSHHGVSAALEYAVKMLEVEHIIVLGHSDCGGIKTLMARDNNNRSSDKGGEFIDSWLDIAEDAKQIVLKELNGQSEQTCNRACEEAALLLSADNLMTFPWVKERVNSKKLSIHLWYFYLETGILYRFDQNERAFKSFSKENF